MSNLNKQTKEKNRLARMVTQLEMKGIHNFTSAEIPNSLLVFWNIERTALNGTLMKMERANLIKSTGTSPRVYTIIK